MTHLHRDPYFVYLILYTVEEETAKVNKQKTALMILLINIFIAFLGIGLVIPILPTIMNELKLSGTVVGNMVAAFAVAQFIGSPFAGRAVDRFGRKIIIVLGLTLFGISEFIFGLGKTVEVLFLSRILGGISASMIMPAVTAFIADITTKETRSKALGYMSAAISTGFIIGPGIGGFIAEFGPRIPFFVAGALGVVAAIISLVVLREPKQSMDESAEAPGAPGPAAASSWKRTFHPVYFVAFLLIFVMSFGLATFEGLFSLFLDHKFSFTSRDVAIAITGGAVLGAISQLLLFDWLTRLIGEIRLTRYCFVLSTIFVFLMTMVSSYFAILLVTFFVFVGIDLMRPAITSYLSKVAGNEQGFVGGMNSMFTSIGNMVGPIIGGLLFDIELNFPYYFATLIFGLGTILAMFWRQSAPSAPSGNV